MAKEGRMSTSKLQQHIKKLNATMDFRLYITEWYWSQTCYTLVEDKILKPARKNKNLQILAGE